MGSPRMRTLPTRDPWVMVCAFARSNCRGPTTRSDPRRQRPRCRA